MIKEVFKPKNNLNFKVNVVQDSAYDVVLNNTREYIRKYYDKLRKLKGEEYNVQIRNIITEFVEGNKPIVTSMIYNGKMNNTKLIANLYQDINQFGPITKHLVEGKLTDIQCIGVGPGRLLGIIGKKKFILRDDNDEILYFKTAEEIESVVNKLLYFAGTRLSSNNSCIRIKTAMGYRLTAWDKSVRSPFKLADDTSLQSATFSIRMSNPDDTTIEDMIHKYKSFPPEIANVMLSLGKLEGIKIWFSGMPGSGKTTMLQELARPLKDLAICALEPTPEFSLDEYDRNGVSTRVFVSYTPTSLDKGDGDMTRGSLLNLYYSTLSTKFDLLIIPEVRSIEEINVMLKSSISGQGLWATIHGEDDETTAERLIKDIQAVKQCSRSEAIEEAYLSLNLVICMECNPIDSVIRPTAISEITKVYNQDDRVRLKFNKLYDFNVTNKNINPDTNRIDGVFRKVGVPTERLKSIIKRSRISQEEEDELLKEASFENPIYFRENW